MNRKERFLWGSFGALLPELLRIYTFVIHQQSLPTLSWKYIIAYTGISVIFMVFAGGFTIAWEAENAFKSVWVGASFPTLISALISTAPSLPVNR
jgi:hypothetical protein